MEEDLWRFVGISGSVKGLQADELWLSTGLISLVVEIFKGDSKDV